MPRRAIQLGVKQIEAIKEPGRHAVGGIDGLCLHVSESGSRSWLLRVTVDGKRRELGLGSCQIVALGDARKRAAEQRLMAVVQGVDPVMKKREERSAAKASKLKLHTFAQALEGFIKDKAPSWKHRRAEADWRQTMGKYALPVIGELLVDHIETAHVLDILRPIWTAKTETATTIRERIVRVIDWASAAGHVTNRERLNPARKSAVEAVLSESKKVQVKTNFAAMPWKDVPAFLPKLHALGTVEAKAVELCILTAVRSVNVRNMVWGEVDLDAGTWVTTNKAEKGADDTDYRVALSTASVELLRSIPRDGDAADEVVFKGMGDDSALLKCLRLVERKATVHGFRSTFKDWAGNNKIDDTLSELALGHAVGSTVRRAYARDDLLEHRVPVMQAWADFLRGVSNVVELKRAA